MANKRIQGITIEIDGNAQKLDKAISSVDSTIRKMNSSLRDVDRLLKFDPRNAELLQQKQRQLGTEIDATKQKLTTLKQASKEAEQQLADGTLSQERFDALQREIIETEQKLKQLEAQAKQSSSVLGMQFEATGRQMKEWGDKVKENGEKIADFGSKMTMRVTLPIVAGFAGATKAAVDWESAFTGVQKTVDASAGEYEELANGIKDMSTRMASSKTEIAGVMEVAGQLGVTGTKDLLNFTETMVELGDTTNLSAEDAATALARFLNITEGGYDNVDRIGSSVVALGNNFATSESEIVAMSTRLAAAGTIAGMSSTDILALSAAMSSVGIEAEAGGTAMAQTMKVITEAVEKAGDATADADGKFTEKLNHIAEISGTTADDFVRAWKTEPARAIGLFVKGLGKLGDEGESATLVLDELGMSGIRQSNMIQSLALASDQLSDAFEVSADAYRTNTALSDEAAKRYDTFAAKLTQTKEKITNVAVEIGERLLPYIDKAIEFVGSLVQKWDALDDKHKDSIVRIGMVVAAIGPLALVIGNVVKVVGTLASGLGNAIQFMGRMMSVAPGLTSCLGIVGGAVAGVVVGYQLYSKWLQKVHDDAAALSDEEQALHDRLQGTEEAIKAQNEAMQDAVAQVDLQYRAEEALIDELESIVDANGKVKVGYEDRAKVITDQLAQAFGIEIKMQDGVIQKYGEVMASIDQVIQKKKAEALLSAGQQAYVDALQGQMQAYKDLQEAQKNYSNQQQVTADAEARYNELVNLKKSALGGVVTALDGTKMSTAALAVATERAKAEMEGEQEALRTLATDVDNANAAFYTGQATITNYDTLLGITQGAAGDLDSAMVAMMNGLVTASTGTEEILVEQAQTAKTNLDTMLQQQKEGSAQFTDEQIRTYQQFSQMAQAELDKFYANQSTAQQTANQNQQNAEKLNSEALRAEQTRRNQQQMTDQMSHDAKLTAEQKKTNDLIGNQDTAARSSWSRALDAYHRNRQTSTQNDFNMLQQQQRSSNMLMLNLAAAHYSTMQQRQNQHNSQMQSSVSTSMSAINSTYSQSMNSLQSSTTSSLNGIQSNFHSTFSGLASQMGVWGNDAVGSFSNALSAGVSRIAAAASNIANQIRSRLHFSVPDIGPLADADTYMPDFIDLLVKGIDKGIPEVAEANDRLAAALVPAYGSQVAVGQMNDTLSARLDILTRVVVEYLPVAASQKEVVIYPDKLVGEIAPDMNRALGAMA